MASSGDPSEWRCLLCGAAVRAEDRSVEEEFFGHFEREHESAEPLYTAAGRGSDADR